MKLKAVSGIMLILFLASMHPCIVRTSPEIVYIELQPNPVASFIVDGIEHRFFAAVITASPYGTGNMVMVIKKVSVNAYSISVYVAAENLLLGEKYGWLTSLIGNGIVIPDAYYNIESVQPASITIEETNANLTATVSGTISLSITYSPYGDNSTDIEDPDDHPYLHDYDGDGFWSYSIFKPCNANGSFSGHQLGLTNFNWGVFDIIDYEWYDLGILAPPPVGGKATPINIPISELELLTPYIGLTMLLVASGVTIVYVKKRKKNT